MLFYPVCRPCSCTGPFFLPVLKVLLAFSPVGFHPVGTVCVDPPVRELLLAEQAHLSCSRAASSSPRRHHILVHAGVVFLVLDLAFQSEQAFQCSGAAAHHVLGLGHLEELQVNDPAILEIEEEKDNTLADICETERSKLKTFR